MAVSLKRALMEILADWPDDLLPEWRDACCEVELGFGNFRMFSKSVRALIQQMDKLFQSGIYNWRYHTESEPHLNGHSLNWPPTTRCSCSRRAGRAAAR